MYIYRVPKFFKLQQIQMIKELVGENIFWLWKNCKIPKFRLNKTCLRRVQYYGSGNALMNFLSEKMYSFKCINNICF